MGAISVLPIFVQIMIYAAYNMFLFWCERGKAHHTIVSSKPQMTIQFTIISSNHTCHSGP